MWENENVRGKSRNAEIKQTTHCFNVMVGGKTEEGMGVGGLINKSDRSGSVHSKTAAQPLVLDCECINLWKI